MFFWSLKVKFLNGPHFYLFFNQNPPKKLTKTYTKLTRKVKHKNKHYKKKKKKKKSIFFGESLPH
jgi:hypothetical protein